MNTTIETLNGLGERICSIGWPILWQSSLLMLVAFCLDHLLARKVRSAVRYALWLAVLVKLLLPPTLALPTGVAWWLTPTKPVAPPPVMKHYTVTYGDTMSLPDYELPNVPLPPPPPPRLERAGWLLLAAATVSAVLLLWMTVRWWQVTRMVWRATPLEGGLETLSSAKALARRRSTVKLKVVEGKMSPAVCGLFCPVILLPRELAEKLSAEQLRAVLLHELFHLRRGDVWVNCAQALLQIVYWWHPLLWIANARIRRLREEAVDDAVMLALRDEADSYAPTLLEVAKLAFRRPLLSLGLVGIMESRSALRQRIERLVDFRAPRKAGLTFASFFAVCIFSAVALPMGEAPQKPVPAADSEAVPEPQDHASVKVNPEIFFRNLRAQAGKAMLASTNEWEILMGLLDGEGVSCNPPHCLAYNRLTEEIATTNAPEQIAVFRQVIKQLNRADGIVELPLGQAAIHRKNVLIEGRIYQMSNAEFEKFTSGLDRYPGGQGGSDWWALPPEIFKQRLDNLAASGATLLQRPRIQTAHGITAEFYVGDKTNSLEFDCTPLVRDGYVDLNLRSSYVQSELARAVTNQVSSRASALNHGGFVLRAENFGGHAGSNLITVISVEILTNTTHFQERLRVVIHRNPMSNGPTVGQIQGISTNPNFQMVKRALEQRGGAETLAAPEVTTRSGRGVNSITMTNISVPVQKNDAKTLVQDGKLLYEMGKLGEAEKKLKAALALDSDNAAAKYYLDLVRTSLVQTNDHVAGLTYTGPGRKAIVRKLDAIRLDNVSFDSLPLSEVLRFLAKQSKLRDPAHEGVNFFINLNPDKSELPAAPRDNSDPVDVGSFIVNIRSLTDVRLADVLDAIVITCDHPIKYSIQDFAVVFSVKGPEVPQLFSRVFKVDANIFYGLPESGKNTNSPALMSVAARKFFTGLGVDLESPKGKSVFFNDKRGTLFVKATESDLDKIERAISAIDQAAPQIHIKARFVKVPKGTLSGLTKMVAITNQPAQSNQLASITGILADENFKIVLRSLEVRDDVEFLAEPEVTTTSGRQTQMRATQIRSLDPNYGKGLAISGPAQISGSIEPRPDLVETGPILDVVPYVLSDDHTIKLNLIPSLTEFLGYDNATNTTAAYAKAGEKIDVPKAQLNFRVRQAVANVNLWDGQTVVLGGLPAKNMVGGKVVPEKTKADGKELLVFVTATIVGSAGNQVHKDGEIPAAQQGISPQPVWAK